MAHWSAKYRPGDMPFEDEVLIGVEGGEYGFNIVDDCGNELSDWPYMTVEEAQDGIKEMFADTYSTFEWLDGIPE